MKTERDWKSIQEDYDSGLSQRDLIKKYGFSFGVLTNGRKRGLFKTRTQKEANIVRYKNCYSIKICPRCSSEHRKEGVYCSRSCGNKRTHSEESKKKTAATMKRLVRLGVVKTPIQADPKNKVTKMCPICGKSFVHFISVPRIHCSRACSNKMDRSGISGGYRDGSGYGKSGWYRGFFLNSTYELAWVIYRLDHGLFVKRFDGYITDGALKYYPDFIDEDGVTIIEIKGYHRIDVDAKTALAISKGYNIEVLYKNDLKKCFEWVKEKYNTSEFETLYDGHKPKYEYFCDFCGKGVERNKKAKTTLIFCSRKCSGSSNRGKNIKHGRYCKK
jgi:hypothetical protein